ncbi:hypothetical protein ABTD78_22550, partial [Acinetobacter baumannii]
WSQQAVTRRGGKAGPNTKRVSVTMRLRDFERLRDIDAARKQSIGGTAAELVASGLSVVGAAAKVGDAT